MAKRYLVIIRIMCLLQVFAAASVAGISSPGPEGASKARPEVRIAVVKVNGKVKNPSERLVLKSTDSVTIGYRASIGQDPEAGAFFYRIALKIATDSSISVTGLPEASYKNLPEGNYEFIAGAFDLKGKWNAVPVRLKFSVDNNEAMLKSRADSLEALLAREKGRTGQPAGRASGAGPGIVEISLFSAGGLILGIMATILLLLPRIKRSENVLKNIKGKKMANQADKTNDEIKNLLAENGNLKAELAALRGQIDAMQARSSEIGKRNRDLENQLALLSSKKEELEELQKQKDELFALIIHDIKNPIALIKSLVELLRSYDLTASEQQEIIDDIAQTTIKIVSLSHEVSKILALEGGSMRMNIEESNIGLIIDDAIQRNTIASKNKNITMFSEIPSGLPSIELDAQKIDEVVDNLISNAIKFTLSGGTVRVKAFKDHTNIVVEVSDNGLGLSEEDVKNAFQRGARLSAQPTGGESSTGLGLWIVKKLIEAHEGRVWVKSALGKGSTFAFSVPIRHSKE